MTDFIIKQLPYDLSNQAGLALIGKYLKRVNINSLVDPAFSVRSGIANSDILKSYLGLLCLGKNDFDAIEGQRKDAFFARAPDLRAVPSSPTLRQRMDTHVASWFDLADGINAAVLGMKISGKPIDFGVLPCGYMPLDVDTFACANSGTVKEHVGRTYAGVDGYCPLAAYLGRQGFCLELALRPGTQHSASETEYNIERVLPMAVRLTSSRSDGGDTASPLLFRADSGFDSAKLMLLEGWSTTLPNAFTPERTIALYADHDTHEQFHSEFKTDMDLVRLPSGKFDTNYLVCALAAVVMNLLRLVGQHTLHEPDSPVRRTAQRRRIRTVVQELMFKAARMVHHARHWVLGLGANDTAFAVFERHWCELDTA